MKPVNRSIILLLTIAVVPSAILAISAVALSPMATGLDYDLSWHRIAGGGETYLTGEEYALGATIGQHDAAAMVGGPEEGQYMLAGGFWSASAVELCPVPGDITCDGTVDTSDLRALLEAWGPSPDCDNCPADLNGDCVVDGADLLILLANWN